MAAKCRKCGKVSEFCGGCSGNVCPECRKKARGVGRAKPAAKKTAVKKSPNAWQVSYGDGRKPTLHDTSQDATKARIAARKKGIRTTSKTVRRDQVVSG